MNVGLHGIIVAHNVYGVLQQGELWSTWAIDSQVTAQTIMPDGNWTATL
jgi:hypothetical protein